MKSDQSTVVLYHSGLGRTIGFQAAVSHFWWKAFKVLTSADGKVQVSAAYSNIDKASVWRIWSLVSSVWHLSPHIHFRDVLTEQARPIRHVRSGRH